MKGGGKGGGGGESLLVLHQKSLIVPRFLVTIVVLARFRKGPVAMMADVEAMFHQVRVRLPDCDSLRFLWWLDNDLSKEPTEYQMLVHLFGRVSSPTCANFALRQTAGDNSEQFDPETVNTVKRNFYVDDCLKSSENEKAAITTADQLRLLLSKGGFRLTKWLSNSRKVIETIPQSKRSKLVKEFRFGELPAERAFGVLWNIELDTFGFAIMVKNKPFTRRGIVSCHLCTINSGLLHRSSYLRKKFSRVCVERTWGGTVRFPKNIRNAGNPG